MSRGTGLSLAQITGLIRACAGGGVVEGKAYRLRTGNPAFCG